MWVESSRKCMQKHGALGVESNGKHTLTFDPFVFMQPSSCSVHVLMFWFWRDVRTVRRTLLLFVVFLFLPLFVPLSEGECWNRAVGSLRFLCVRGSDDFFKQIWSRCELCNISSQKRNWIVKFVANANVCKENCRSGILKTFSFGLFVFNFVHLRCVTLLMRRLR